MSRWNFVDETGKRYGNLVVIERAPTPPNKTAAFWRCLCDCGTERIASGGALRGGNTWHCGCLNTKKLIDETGNRYGHLVVLERVPPPSKDLRKGDAWWKCRCDCGSTNYVSRGHTLRSSQAWHCGCLKFEVQSQAQLRSGHLRLPEKQAAFNMLYRGYRRSAKKREIHFELTEEDFSFLTQMNCFYCGDEPGQYVANQSGSTYCHNGVDRRDPTGGYTMDNVVPCCKICNIMKRNYKQVPFLWHISKIQNYRGLSHA